MEEKKDLDLDQTEEQTEAAKEPLKEASAEAKEASAEAPAETAEAPVSEEEPAGEAGQGSAPEPGEAPGGGGQEKKGLFKKKKDKKDEQIAELTDKVKRQLAEFENFRNRTEKEKSQMFEIGARSVLEKLLPVLDSFERGLTAIPEEEKESPVASGMEKIYKQFTAVLTDVGVTPIEAVGKEFDPNLHNAVMHEENEELGENIVAEELQKGYQYKDAVLRHSMVKVAN